MEMNDMRLKRVVEALFNQSKADVNDPAVLAAIITAASKMARCSEMVTEDITVEQLLDLYEKVDDPGLTKLIGMGPQFVKANIGYSVDFNDYGSSMANYNQNKELYDGLYSDISNRAISKANDIRR